MHTPARLVIFKHAPSLADRAASLGAALAPPYRPDRDIDSSPTLTANAGDDAEACPSVPRSSS